MIDPSHNTEPFYINKEGTKWWKSALLTEHARNPDINKIRLNITCAIIETTQKYKTYVLINYENEIVYENQSAEAVYCYINILKNLEHRDKPN